MRLIFPEIFLLQLLSLGIVDVCADFELVCWCEIWLGLEQLSKGLLLPLDLFQLVLGQENAELTPLDMLGDLGKVIGALNQPEVQVAHPKNVAVRIFLPSY